MSAAAVILLVAPASAGASTAAGAALPAWPAAPDWQQYVEAPSSLNLNPVRAVSFSGDVSNPNGIVGAWIEIRKPPAPLAHLTVMLPMGSTRYSVTVNGHLVHLSAGQTEVTVG